MFQFVLRRFNNNQIQKRILHGLAKIVYTERFLVYIFLANKARDTIRTVLESTRTRKMMPMVRLELATPLL